MNSELLKQAIADAKSVRMLALAWTEGQFYGHMKYKSYDSNEVERASCNCRYCYKPIKLEDSASHAQVCKEELSSSFGAIFAAKLKEDL